MGIPALPGIDENSINSQVRKEEREFYLIYTEDYIYKILRKYEKLEAIMAIVKEENILEQGDLSGKHIEQRLYLK